MEQITREKEEYCTILKKENETQLLREEIVEQVKLRQPLYLAMISAGALILYQSLQPTVSPLSSCVLPLVGLSLALNMSVHDLRAGQLSFYQRRILRSPWEIIRRVLWNGTALTDQEKCVLVEQNIVITDSLLRDAQKLLPLLPELYSLSTRLMFLTFEGAAVGILCIRTYEQVVRLDLLTIFAWIIAMSATIVTWMMLGRKRVR